MLNIQPEMLTDRHFKERKNTLGVRSQATAKDV